MTGEIHDGNPLQAQGPGGQQVESTIPRKIIDTCRGFEKHNRRAGRRRGLTSNALGKPRDFSIIEPADKSALDSLFEEFSEHEIWFTVQKCDFVTNLIS